MTLVSLSTCQILVVEDDYLIAHEIETWLRQLGAKVMGPASSASAALHLIDAKVPDLAILDVNLSGGERSFPVAERLNELGIPYLFATGCSDLMSNPVCWSRPILIKPVGCRELLTALKKLLSCKLLSSEQEMTSNKTF